jgi:hypothetical protein
VIWRVDFGVLTENVSIGEAGFGNVAFSIKLDNANSALNLGWQPANSNSTFAWNMDAGPSASDLHGILVSIAPAITNPDDVRTKVGQGDNGPTTIGSIFIQDDFLNLAGLSVEQVTFASYTPEGKFQKYSNGLRRKHTHTAACRCRICRSECLDYHRSTAHTRTGIRSRDARPIYAADH